MPTKAAEPEWVRVSEAARRTGINHTTIWRWAVAGRIKWTQPGGVGTAMLIDFSQIRTAFNATVKHVSRNAISPAPRTKHPQQQMQ